MGFFAGGVAVDAQVDPGVLVLYGSGVEATVLLALEEQRHGELPKRRDVVRSLEHALQGLQLGVDRGGVGVAELGLGRHRQGEAAA